ncbi:hypothetical protein [uncultured Cedecea sp.]|nr:hypothetical protein [uncultured Cedecea sp.]
MNELTRSDDKAATGQEHMATTRLFKACVIEASDNSLMILRKDK